MPNLEWIESCFSAFSKIGKTPAGGYTRLGYTQTEDEMHAALAAIAGSLGLVSANDSAGNLMIADPMYTGEKYILIGSHLDSVIDGGNFDGVAGIVAGLYVLAKAKQQGVILPVKLVAFRCEESANFNVCTIGSELFCGVAKAGLASLRGRDGVSLGALFAKAGYSFSRVPGDPALGDITQYVELHIEQGRVLESEKINLGVVSSIAGNRRFSVDVAGLAEHSGATPMAIRADALCAAAEIVLATERLGKREAAFGSVATVGLIENTPNAMNTIPGAVRLGVDLRGNDGASLLRMEREFPLLVQATAKSRGVACGVDLIGAAEPVAMDSAVMAGLSAACNFMELSSKVMPSGAGHDASCLAQKMPAGMLFIPCAAGISHNPREHADFCDVLNGAEVLYQYVTSL